MEEGTLCSQCLDRPPPYKMARSAVLYNDASKGLVLRFKHADRLHPAKAMALWMVRAGAEVWAQADLIAPVPLHRGRLLKRRYNQSSLLAQAVGKQIGKTVIVDLLVRRKATDSQGHRTFKERHENVAGAFALHKRYDVTSKKIVLIDDVLTSGATACECARVLLREGAAEVFVVTFARVRMAV